MALQCVGVQGLGAWGLRVKLLRVLGSAALGLRLRVSHMRLLSSRIHGLGFRGLRSIGFSPQVATFDPGSNVNNSLRVRNA